MKSRRRWLLVLLLLVVAAIACVVLFAFPSASSLPSTQQVSLIGNDDAPPTAVGWSVDISYDGTTLVVGGPNDNSNIGATWVFQSTNSQWTSWAQQGSKLLGSSSSSPAMKQGYAVAIAKSQANTIIVGRPTGTSIAGCAYIFTRSGSTWTEQALLFASDHIGDASQGFSVALSADGNTAIFGGLLDNGSVGAAWVWVRSAGVWSQQAKLIGSPASSFQFGYAVSLSADGNTAIIGANVEGTTGCCFIFVRTGVSWAQHGGKLLPSDATVDANFGQAVAINAAGDTAIIGGAGDNGVRGAVWIFIKDESDNWSQSGPKITGSDSTPTLSQFGTAVSINSAGTIAAVGAPLGGLDGNGRAYILTRSGNTFQQAGASFSGTGLTSVPYFGQSVAISNQSTMAVGAPSAGASQEGAVLVFV